MNDKHRLTREEIRRLRSSIETVEFTGNQLAVLSNALAFTVTHHDCHLTKNSYSALYYEEVRKLHQYISSYVEGILGNNGEETTRNASEDAQK